MAVKRRCLTDANVARLAPAAREYTVWDTRYAGLGVRVRPSGHRSFVYRRKGEGDARRITLGTATLTSVDEARAECLALETGARSGGPEGGPVPTFADFVAGPGKTCFDRGKPSTRKAQARVVAARLLPAFGPMPLDRITRADVTRWFDERSRTAPGAANKALSLLCRILNHAIVCSHLQTNPAHGIKWNPGAKLTRFLSRDEVSKLHHALDHLTAVRPSRARQADAIRLLLLTGMPQKRDPDLTLAGGGRGHDQPDDVQDGTETGVSECAGTGDPGAAAAIE